jgi:hypothetical protein
MKARLLRDSAPASGWPAPQTSSMTVGISPRPGKDAQRLLRVGSFSFGLAGKFGWQSDAQRAQEIHVGGAEGPGVYLVFFAAAEKAGRRGGFFFEFVEADGRFEHQHYVEALFANLADDSGDVFRF